MTKLNFLILVLLCLFISCEEEEVVEDQATVVGSITLPVQSAGKQYLVAIDDDLVVDNGTIKTAMGVTDLALSASYQMEDVPAGTYYVYGIVYAAGNASEAPVAGDYYGIYGSTMDNPIPATANVVVPSTGELSLNLDLELVQGEIQTGEWIATAESMTIYFTVNELSNFITEVNYQFNQWNCGGVTMSGGFTVSRNPGWLIADRLIDIETDLDPDPFEDDPLQLKGAFGIDGKSANGTWEADVNGEICTGNWEATPSA